MNFRALTAGLLSSAVCTAPAFAQHNTGHGVTAHKSPIATAIGCGINDFNNVAYSRLFQTTHNNPHHVLTWGGGLTSLDFNSGNNAIAGVGISVLCNNVNAGSWSLTAATDTDTPSDHMFAATTGQDANGFLFSFNGDVVKTTLANGSEKWTWNAANTFDPFQNGAWPSGSTITNFWVADAGLDASQLPGNTNQFTFNDTITNIVVDGVPATYNTHQGLAFDCNGFGLAIAGILTGLNS